MHVVLRVLMMLFVIQGLNSVSIAAEENAPSVTDPAPAAQQNVESDIDKNKSAKIHKHKPSVAPYDIKKGKGPHDVKRLWSKKDK